MQNIATSLENWHLLKKLSSHLPYDLGILPLGIYTGDIKAYVHAKTYTQKFIAALFVTKMPNKKLVLITVHPHNGMIYRCLK